MPVPPGVAHGIASMRSVQHGTPLPQAPPGTSPLVPVQQHALEALLPAVLDCGTLEGSPGSPEPPGLEAGPHDHQAVPGLHVLQLLLALGVHLENSSTLKHML